MIITIDGYAGTGKTTIAELFAQKYNFVHINSGLIYRTITYELLRLNVNSLNYQLKSDVIENYLTPFTFEIHQNRVITNSDKIEIGNLKTNEIAHFGSLIAQLSFVRRKVNFIQRTFAQNKNVIVEGRDTGTVVFPNADLKFFFIADVKVRALRMSKLKYYQNLSVDELQKLIQERDFKDETRIDAPLMKPLDAKIMDTTKLSIQEFLKSIDIHFLDFIEKIQ